MRKHRDVRYGTITKGLVDEETASAAVEFALNGSALFAFVFVIINLGDLGLSLGILRHGVQVAVREAVVQTGTDLSQTGNAADCVTGADVTTFFNNIAAPILPAATGSTSDGTPIVQTSWSNSVTGGTLPGTALTVTASYLWKPIGMPSILGSGLQLYATSTQLVVGTSGASTSCN